MVKFDNQDMFDDQIGFFNILKAAPISLTFHSHVKYIRIGFPLLA
jgi:hypothetical protein